jgi:hypothetical protein
MYQTEIGVFSDLCYYSLTTVLGMQTLGEEYCDIMQIKGSTGTFPTLAVSSSCLVRCTVSRTWMTDMSDTETISSRSFPLG